MFSLEFLNELRECELRVFEQYFRPGTRLLEIGGGTGMQAKRLSERGYDVVSIEVPNSNYSTDRVFPMIEYDGKALPFADGVFDVVFSSNVLEHVPRLDLLHAEIARVLTEDGFSVHAMPSATWRLWTTLANYVELVQCMLPILPQLLPQRFHRHERHRIRYVCVQLAKLIIMFGVSPRHGEVGNAFTELWTFSRLWWRRHFTQSGYEIVAIEPMRLFYTGHTLVGLRLSFARRAGMARYLGSSCILYHVR